MAFDLRGATIVLLPGTGSDDDYIRRAFSRPVRRAGADLVAPRPQPERLISGYLDALDAAAGRHEPLLVGGVSIGAAVTIAWALRHPEQVTGVLAALPPWTGSPADAPAALAARHSADQLRRTGLPAAIARLRATSPAWLADELARSWARQWPRLPDAMDEAASYVGPNRSDLRRLAVPLGVAGAEDDPIHPLAVAVEWVTAAPRAALRTVTLDRMGEDPARLGAACLAAVVDAGADQPPISRR